VRRRLYIMIPALLVGVVLGVHGCVAIPRIAASGKVAGYPLRGPVDSDVARDYLEGRPLPSELEGVRQRYLASGQVPPREVLATASRQYSPDVATLLFIETLSALPEIRDLRQRYEAELSHVRRVGVERARPDIPDSLLVLMVPGWFYVAHGSETNSDYRIQRKLLDRWGIAHRLVPVKENGTVEDNARIVAGAIREALRDHQVLLVSASKSGAEVALALGRELKSSETESVVGWLSIVGVVRGSPLADRVLQPDLCWFAKLKLGLVGFDLEGAKSMQTSRARSVFDNLRFPPHIRTFAYVAIPLSGQISKRGSFGYGRMRELGPNDGLTLLSDELIPGAVPLLVPGVDHFLPEDQDLWSTAVFRVFAAEVAGRYAMGAASSSPVSRAVPPTSQAGSLNGSLQHFDRPWNAVDNAAAERAVMGTHDLVAAP
jgi:hypothetical protein